jgi:5'-3' exonuclease
LKYDLVIISEEEGFKNLLYQILQGDSTDNISGLQGFGEKALEKFKTDIDGPSIKAEHLVYHIMKLYTDRYGILKGFDTFVEMWSLVSLRLDRGAYNRDKYATAFYLIEKLCKDANNSGDIDSTNV